MSGKKIALISEHASPLAALGGVDAGGQNVVVGELAQQLANLGYEVDVFTRRDDESLEETIQWRGGVRVIHVQAGPIEYIPKETLLAHMPEFTRNVLAFCKTAGQPYQLFHAHFFMSGLVAAELKKQLGTPYIVTFHALGKVRRQYQGDADAFPEERLGIEQRVIDEADQIIALCPQDQQDLTRLYNADPARISVIPNGYNVNDFYPIDQHLARDELGLNQEEHLILQLGRLVPRKGIDNVIEALAILHHAKQVPTRLLVVGGNTDDPDPVATPEIGRLQQIARDQGIAAFVTFTGRREPARLRYYYSAADVFVTTPWYEPFGMTPLESMACGTPVIGSRVGGIKHTIQDGENGFLVPAKQPQALADRLSGLLENRELLSYFRANALEYVANFDWATVAKQTAALYERIGGAADEASA